MPLFLFSDQKTIALEVTVTNQNGDDAYEASVLASFPRSLTYSTARSLPNVSLCSLSHILYARIPICGPDWNLLYDFSSGR